jgi:hypothetical protein
MSTSRFYGRTARLFGVGQITPEQTGLIPNPMAEWVSEIGAAHADYKLRAIKRYACIDDMTASYPTEHPRLPERQD